MDLALTAGIAGALFFLLVAALRTANDLSRGRTDEHDRPIDYVLTVRTVPLVDLPWRDDARDLKAAR
jgi:hypothetical protein